MCLPFFLVNEANRLFTRFLLHGIIIIISLAPRQLQIDPDTPTKINRSSVNELIIMYRRAPMIDTSEVSVSRDVRGVFLLAVVTLTQPQPCAEVLAVWAERL